jgi:hypothetical protein
MSDDFISNLSQSKHTGKTESIFFPEIPDPPPGFDPEASPLFQDSTPQSVKAVGKKKRPKLIPKARVFIIGASGNKDYNEILYRGISGEVILGRKEISDLKGSDKYKVYLEWMEVPAKVKG